MSVDTVDLDAYFARIAYNGSRAPTLSTLNGIVAAHAQRIPFENLDVLLGRPIALDLPSIQNKLVRAGRGGYCFEQNGLLLNALDAMGFKVTPLSARVRIQRPRDYLPPRTHLFVRVDLDDVVWLADVGVGGLSLTAPIRLDFDGAQATPHEPRRIVREGGRWFHQAQLGSEWADVCEFTMEEMPPIDRELANWFTSAHPQSHFRGRLMVARAGASGERLTLLNAAFTIRAANGTPQTRTLASEEERLAVLAEHFGLQLPEGTRFGCLEA